MSEEFGPDFVSLTDEDGNELELEYVDTLEYEGEVYMAFFPAVEEGADPDLDEDYGLVILKVVNVDGEEHLATPDSEEELEAVFEQFNALLFDEDDT